MLNEKELKKRLDEGLSRLSASPRHRACIRMRIDQERQERKPMKRSARTMIAAVLITVVLMATVAIAESLNLFDLFGEKDERYKNVSRQAQLQNPVTVQVDFDAWEPVQATIDSAYFDGLSLNLAFRVDRGLYAEPWTPDEAQLAAMTKTDKTPVLIEAGHPDSDVYRAYNEALDKGTPFGMRAYSVYASDHTTAEDGTDLEPASMQDRYTEEGVFAEMREFACPLPEHIAAQDELKLSIRLCRAEEWLYFDGNNCYRYNVRSEAGTLEAVVPKTTGQTVFVRGSGKIGSLQCTVEGEVSPMAAVLTVTADGAVGALLEGVPENVDERDQWLEVWAVDEQGRVYRPLEDAVRDAAVIRVPLQGTGEVPEQLTLYITPCYEGMEDAALIEGEGIALTVTAN